MTEPAETASANHWVTTAHPPFAQWQATFPRRQSEPALRAVLAAVRSILQSGEREHVYRVEETRGPNPFRVGPDWSYSDFLEAELASGASRLFDVGVGAAPTGEGQLRTPGRVCYFDADGAIVEGDVDDLGELLRRLRPSLDSGRRYTAAVAPVTLHSRPIRIGDESAPIRIVVELLTDLWFPRTRGYLERDLTPPDYAPRWYDNMSLARRHTPRLNRFLAGARRAVIENGGEWTRTPAADCVPDYAAMVADAGLVLEE